MIQASELRIGNYLSDFQDRLVKVNAIREHGIRCRYNRRDTGEEHSSLYDCSNLSPIPLTPEILEKCGFEKVKSPYEEAETDDFFLTPLYFDMANTSIKINGVYQKINYPESLHQLQNLYHALTGEELTYNVIISG